MEYPAFYEEHIRQVISDYNAARSAIQNAVSFFFITDLHIHLNGRSAVPLMLEIADHTDVKTVLCGGDICWAWGSKAECISQLEDCLTYMDPLKQNLNLYIARGNHDATVRNSRQDPRGYTMPFEQLQPYFAAHNSPASGAVEGKLYFYADDAETKTRFVILDCTELHEEEGTGWGVKPFLSREQICWLADVALRLPGDEWSVVAMGHIACVPQISSHEDALDALREILEAFQKKGVCQYGDFSDAKGQLIAYLCGHNHVDRQALVNNVLHISTGCDAYCKDDIYPRDVGSINNTLFDLFLVDKDNRTVQTFRIGAGERRKLTY